MTETYSKFDDMNLKKDLLRGIYTYGFENPSQIQSKSIVPLYQGNDIIAQAQSGTGKTGAFTIGTLQRIEEKEKFTQALILAPTRELADQIYNVILSLSSSMENLEIELCIGGVKSKVLNRWNNKSQIIIGTPGRILDNLSRKKIDVSKLKMVVLDEADEMLSRGFLEQVYEIFKFIPKDSQVALYSATIPNEILEMTSKFMNNPLQILVKQEEITLEGIKQFYILLEKKQDKIDCLIDLFEMISITQAIIYTNTKKMAEELFNYLTTNSFPVGIITGNMTQLERNSIMDEYRKGKTRVLISTDMLARGIDIQQISLVINFDISREKETYIHRIGRSGRFGRKGVAINLIIQDEYEDLQNIEKFYQTKIEEMPENISDYF